MSNEFKVCGIPEPTHCSLLIAHCSIDAARAEAYNPGVVLDGELAVPCTRNPL